MGGLTFLMLATLVYGWFNVGTVIPLPLAPHPPEKDDSPLPPLPSTWCLVQTGMPPPLRSAWGPPPPRKGWLTTAFPLPQKRMTHHCPLSPRLGSCYIPVCPLPLGLQGVPFPQKKMTYHCIPPPPEKDDSPLPPLPSTWFLLHPGTTPPLGQQGVPRLRLPLVSVTYWYDPHLCDVDDIWLMVVAVNHCFTSLFSTKIF